MALNRRANRADDVRCWGHTGKLVLDLSFSGFDHPERALGAPKVMVRRA